ncbi:MAG: polysaccharide pyruvyl transferase family protein [Pedobacter sp.]|jgi:polysaccharide pyruvyl transferase WcaK-like protein|uniref:polysaccharide pyruvyl transferase family protein n=1 Tax=Pedobacter sp. TaxID=1411316 RepID=UPI00356742AF
MQKVLVINEGYSHNLGDQAILEAATRFYEDKGYAVDFLYLSKPTIQALPTYNYTSSALTRIKKNNLVLKLKASLSFFHWFLTNRKVISNTLSRNNYAIVSIGGGQLINTSGTNFPSAFAIALFWFTHLIKKQANQAKLYFVAIGAATQFNKVERYLYQSALNKADHIWVRDEFSQHILNKIYAKKADLIPDIAFYKSKHTEVPIKTDVALVGIASYEEVVLKYNKAVTKDTYFASVFLEIEGIQKMGLTVKLFYTTLLDVTAINEYNEYLVSENKVPHEICAIQNLADLVQELKKAKLVYSGRMHALILGLKYGCEVRPYLLSQKLRSFNEAYIAIHKDVREISKEVELGLAPIFNS